MRRIFLAIESPFPEHDMMLALADVVPCYSAVLNIIRLGPNDLRSWSSQRPQPSHNQHPAVRQHLQDHPWMPAICGQPSHPAVRLGDRCGKRELERNAFVAGFYRPNGLRHQVVFGAGRAPASAGVFVVGVNRMDTRDFNRPELDTLEALRPHVETALHLLAMRREREAATAARDQAGAAAGTVTLTVDHRGRPLDLQRPARDLLARWTAAPDTLPPAVSNLCKRLGGAGSFTGNQGFVRLQDARGSTLEVTARRADTAGRIGLCLREIQPLAEGMIERRHGLTARQAQVALWIAEGKNNQQIGTILGVSPRTVEKHVEALLDRLHLESRTQVARFISG